MDSKEFTTVKIESWKWQGIVEHCNLQNQIDYEIKLIQIKDDYFKDDEMQKSLSKRAKKAYKDLQDYEFKTRHNIKTK